MHIGIELSQRYLIKVWITPVHSSHIQPGLIIAMRVYILQIVSTQFNHRAATKSVHRLRENTGGGPSTRDVMWLHVFVGEATCNQAKWGQLSGEITSKVLISYRVHIKWLLYVTQYAFRSDLLRYVVAEFTKELVTKLDITCRYVTGDRGYLGPIFF